MGGVNIIAQKNKWQLREERRQGKESGLALIKKSLLDTVKQAAILQADWKQLTTLQSIGKLRLL